MRGSVVIVSVVVLSILGAAAAVLLPIRDERTAAP